MNKPKIFARLFARHTRPVAPSANRSHEPIQYEPITCANAQGELDRLRDRVGQLMTEKAQLTSQNANNIRLMGNAMTIAFNSGRQLASLLGVDMFSMAAVPVLATDGQSVTVDFDTLTVVVAPYAETITVGIRHTTEMKTFSIEDGGLTHGDQDVILGMLERSRRDNKSLDDVLSLKGVGVA